ncbi:MAG: sensor histidine kinase [Candidatus Abyssobacteria bacterium SURF_5]|uniref:histidine kinase n=1 Tax=Abyssobacteria bacterium (strain SURF_5) TaxID=2093360 RepID=A0A3A4NA75_ABYX5|nr:MAG: sensor histidine kinase [Candidatus Abyssubacteria bacterium SURF_5]
MAGEFKNIRRIILRRVLLVPFVTLALVFCTLVYYFATNLRSQVETQLLRVADAHRNMIEGFLRERCFDLQYVAASNSFDELSNKEHLATIFEQLQMRSRAFFDIGLFNENGDHVAYVGPFELEGRKYAQAPWFLQVQQKDVYISDQFLGYRNVPHFIIAVRRDEGSRTWYLRTTIDWFYFNDLVENVRVGKTGEAYIVNEEGVFQTRRRSGGELLEVDPDHSIYRFDQRTIFAFTAVDYKDESHIYAAGKIEPMDWFLIVRQGLNDAYAPLIRAVVIAIIMIIAGGGLAVFMAFMLASGVANQLAMADMEKRRMGTQLIMAGKLAEVGEMSAGVAHEMNNPLQVIKGEEAYIKDILLEAERNGGIVDAENLRLLRESIDQIALQVERGKLITEGLLGFARKTETKIDTFDIRSLISDVVGMIERRAQVENIRIVQEYEASLPVILSDQLQLQQVFLNLLNNAIDALKPKRGGEIRITASSADDEMSIAVTDNGTGIPAEHMEKIFLPFFTTKPVGQGTGLGLSTCYGIIERLGGQIMVSSELNVGTVFTVRLPLAGPPERDEKGTKTLQGESPKWAPLTS